MYNSLFNPHRYNNYLSIIQFKSYDAYGLDPIPVPVEYIGEKKPKHLCSSLVTAGSHQ